MKATENKVEDTICREHELSASREKECVICMTEMAEDATGITQIELCNHRFHTKCLDDFKAKEK